jgi:hypothetical protein
MAEARPESRNSVAVGVGRQTGSTPLVASASVLPATQWYFVCGLVSSRPPSYSSSRTVYPV